MDLRAKVGSARAAPSARPVRAAEVFPTPTPSTAAPGLYRWQCPTSISPSGATGTVAPRPPHKRARGRIAFASRESIHSYIPMPHPRACSRHSSPLESRAPGHILHTLAVFPRPSPAALPRPPNAQPWKDTSASSRLGDSDPRQHVHDTFAIAVKGYRVGTGGGASAHLRVVSAPRGRLSCSGARLGALPHLCPACSLRSRQSVRAGSSKQGRPKGDEDWPQFPLRGVYQRMGSGG